jgi:hypothetical protein
VTSQRQGHSATTRLLCRMVSRARGRLLPYAANSARASSRLLPANSSTCRPSLVPQLDLEEVAPVGDRGIVGLLAEGWSEVNRRA